jgi:hypothetical protein
MAIFFFYMLKLRPSNMADNYWFSGEQNIIDNIIIWIDDLYKSCRFLS